MQAPTSKPDSLSSKAPRYDLAIESPASSNIKKRSLNPILIRDAKRLRLNDIKPVFTQEFSHSLLGPSRSQIFRPNADLLLPHRTQNPEQQNLAFKSLFQERPVRRPSHLAGNIQAVPDKLNIQREQKHRMWQHRQHEFESQRRREELESQRRREELESQRRQEESNLSDDSLFGDKLSLFGDKDSLFGDLPKSGLRAQSVSTNAQSPNDATNSPSSERRPTRVVKSNDGKVSQREIIDRLPPMRNHNSNMNVKPNPISKSISRCNGPMTRSKDAEVLPLNVHYTISKDASIRKATYEQKRLSAIQD